MTLATEALIVVTGSREADPDAVLAILRPRIEALYKTHHYVEVLHGGCATGADLAAARLGEDGAASVIERKADWATQGKRAGPIRNLAMMNYARKQSEQGVSVTVMAFPAQGAANVGTRGAYKMAKDMGLAVEHHMVPMRKGES